VISSNTRLRYASFELAEGRAESWVDATSGEVSETRRYTLPLTNGSGNSRWPRCSAPNCLGETVRGGHCIAHSSSDERSGYVRDCLQRDRAISLRGVEVDQALWDAVLHARRLDSAATPVNFWCAKAIITFHPTLADWQFDDNFDFGGATLERGFEARDCSLNSLNFSYAHILASPATLQRCEVGHLSLEFGHVDQHFAASDCQLPEGVMAKGFGRTLLIQNSDVGKGVVLDSALMKHVSFSDSTLRGPVALTGTRADFLGGENTTFQAASLVGPLHATSVQLIDAHFESMTRWDITGEHLDLSGASFRAGAAISIKDAATNIEHVSSSGQLSLRGDGRASITSIGAADAAALSLSSIDMTRCLFNDAHRLSAISLGADVVLLRSPRRFRARRRCIFDEYVWRSEHASAFKKDWRLDGLNVGPTTSGDRVGTPLPDLTAGQVASSYRALRASLEHQSNQPGADDFYFGEMEMRRRSTQSSRAERFLIWMYWFSAGYGLRPWRPLALLSLLWVLGAYLFRHLGLEGSPDLHTGFLASAQSILPGISVNAKLTQAGNVLDLTLAVLGPILIGLMLLAVRNRIKR
jgi:hypothetical protein